MKIYVDGLIRILGLACSVLLDPSSSLNCSYVDKTYPEYISFMPFDQGQGSLGYNGYHCRRLTSALGIKQYPYQVARRDLTSLA